jgi:hypothetical protein
MLYKCTVIHVDALRLYLNGERLPEHKRARPVRAYLTIKPGSLVVGCGPQYRALPEARRPASYTDSMWPVLGDCRTRIEDGVIMIYGSENVSLPGGGYLPKPQQWACRPVIS